MGLCSRTVGVAFCTGCPRRSPCAYLSSLLFGVEAGGFDHLAQFHGDGGNRQLATISVTQAATVDPVAAFAESTPKIGHESPKCQYAEIKSCWAANQRDGHTNQVSYSLIRVFSRAIRGPVFLNAASTANDQGSHAPFCLRFAFYRPLRLPIFRFEILRRDPGIASAS